MSLLYRRVFIVGLVIGALSLFSMSFAPLPIARAGHSASASCSGNDLVISWSGTFLALVTISGNGPGLPGSITAFAASGSILFTGPGTWTGLSVTEAATDTILISDTTCPSSTSGGTTSTTTGELPPGPPFLPGDDRLNPDPAAPVAIYCRAGGIEVYTIDRTGRGQFAFAASQAQINGVGIPSVNTLIASGAGAGLYRLTSGEFQVNSTRASSTQPKVQAQETGQTIIHTVQRGENLFRIALRYGTTVAAVSQLNGITDPTRIFVGQQLTIVVGSRGATGTTPTTGTQGAPTSAGIGAGYVFIFGGC